LDQSAQGAGYQVIEGQIAAPSGGALPLTIVEVTERRITAMVTGAAEFSGVVRCAFLHRGDHPGRVELMAKVEHCRVSGTAVGLVLKAVALYSKAGRTTVEEFLGQSLRWSDISEDHWVTDRTRLYFSFNPHSITGRRYAATRKKRQIIEAPTGPRIEQRWQRRVRQSLAIEGQVDRIDFKAELRDVCERGVRIRTEHSLAGGDRVRLSIPIAAGRLKMNMRATAKVAWTSHVRDDGTCSAGLLLEQVHDGAHGKHWQRFVEACAESGEIIVAHERGAPLPAQ